MKTTDDIAKKIKGITKQPLRTIKSYLGSIQNDLNADRNTIRFADFSIEISDELKNELYNDFNSILTETETETENTKGFEDIYSSEYAEKQIELNEYIIEQDYVNSLQLEKNKEKYEAKKQLHISTSKGCNCTRCGGSGRVRYNYANGICFKCFGTGKI